MTNFPEEAEYWTDDADGDPIISAESDEDIDLTPKEQCGTEDAHGGHRWRSYRHGPFPRWRRCDGYVGRAGVPAADAPTADPLVLSLPTVPDGAVALIGAKSNCRYDWLPPNGDPVELAEILAAEGSVTVVMREPRTWPKLSKGPADVRIIRGTSGQTWYRDEIRHDLWRADNGAIVHGDIPGLQALDGPLTEVFDDEPGGAR